MRRLSDDDKNIIRDAKYCQTDLARMLGFTPHTIRQFTDKEKIILPIKKRSKLPDLTGQKFNRLSIIRKVKSEKQRITYECKCDCGNITFVEGYYLLKGNIKSCGCYHKDEIKKRSLHLPGMASAHSVYCNYRSNATRKRKEFNLSEEEFIKLSTMNCYYCGIYPQNSTKRGHASTPFIYNGIDRVNNDIGYTKENCVPCCKRCNSAKNNMSKNEFLEWIDRVFNHTKEMKNV